MGFRSSLAIGIGASSGEARETHGSLFPHRPAADRGGLAVAHFWCLTFGAALGCGDSAAVQFCRSKHEAGHGARRCCGFLTSGSRTGHHAFTHGKSRATGLADLSA
jgi:hypothetical protein